MIASGGTLQTIDTAILQKRVVRHFKSVDPVFGKALARILKEEAWRDDGLWPRGVANILYYTWTIQRVRGVDNPSLPSVAQYLMGRREAGRTGGRRRQREEKRRAKEARVEMAPLPNLDRLVDRLP